MPDPAALTESATEMVRHIADVLGDRLEDHTIEHGELTIRVPAPEIVNVLRFLRDDRGLQFVCIIDICGVDWPERPQRFDVVYHLLSPRHNARIRVKLATDEATPVPSATVVLPG
ncbi:MAG TPA: NADH-quinone oxidoreductase subunit C, partial [Afifellaceae bacterium]|nr:NADH-quinone oxidoreductase subunit C [Afifellaceae bacterium]